jgi:PA-IL-like protein
MLKRTILTLALSALMVPIAAFAQENTTITLRSGEKLNAQLIDLGGVGFTVKVNGQERQIPTGEVAIVDFGGGDMTDADWARFNAGSNAVWLKNGQTVNGQLYDIGGTSPLKITFKTDSGDREFSSSEISRIVLARPTNAVATSGSATVPAGEGVAVSANQAWTPTGMTVRRGDVLTFNATGEARLSTDQADMARPSGTGTDRKAPNAPLPQVPAGALIARVGNGAPFPIGGPTATVTMPANGELFLGINDDDLNDNQGGYRVNVQRSNRNRR